MVMFRSDLVGWLDWTDEERIMMVDSGGEYCTVLVLQSLIVKIPSMGNGKEILMMSAGALCALYAPSSYTLVHLSYLLLIDDTIYTILKLLSIHLGC